MAKYLRDIAVWMPSSDEATRWALSTNFLRLLYLDSLPKLETKSVTKVIITPYVPPEETRLEMTSNSAVFQLLKPFDFDNYWKADKESRKQVALNFLQEGLLEVAKLKGWETSPLCEAYATVLKQSLVSDRPWSKEMTSPDRQIKARVWCRYDSDKADIYLLITKREETVLKAEMASVKPGDVWINDVIGKLEWSANREVTLTSRNKAQSWKISVPASVSRSNNHKRAK